MKKAVLPVPRLAALAAGLLLGAGPAAAEVILKDIQWRVAERRGQRKVYRALERWEQAPSPTLKAKPRAVITLANRGPKPAEGVLLSYAVSARLAKVGSGGEGVWAVPFWTEERRVMRLKPNEIREVPIDSLRLATYLRRSYRFGVWPDAIKLHVMIEPSDGEPLAGRIRESVLPVDSGGTRP